MDFDLMDISRGLARLVDGARERVVMVESGGRRASGFVWGAEGLIVTASHPFSDENDLRVALEDGRSLPAKLKGFDNRFDLALLETEVRFGAPELRPAAEVKVGELVFPLARTGDGMRAVFGLVTARGGSWNSALGGFMSVRLETDAWLPAGFSGGPLLDAKGRVLGMNSSLPRGAGMTVPVEDLRRLASELESRGTPRRVRLGVATVPAGLPAALSDGRAGLLITQVMPDSPAEEAGLLVGDILISLAGRRLAGAADLLDGMTGLAKGEQLEIEFARGGEKRAAKFRT